jgi:hypothetical protein
VWERGRRIEVLKLEISGYMILAAVSRFSRLVNDEITTRCVLNEFVWYLRLPSAGCGVQLSVPCHLTEVQMRSRVLPTNQKYHPTHFSK